MLVLTRKSGESIVIGQDIEVKVLSVEGGTIRIGVDAPREVPVYRREVFEAIKEENIRAVRSATVLGRQLEDILKKGKEDSS